MSSLSSTNPKLQRTIARFRSKVDNKDYYEAHQTLRSLINRAVNSNQIEHAVDLIYHGSTILLDSKQCVSASDLMLYLFQIAKDHPDFEIDIGKITTLISKFPVEDPSFNKIASEAVSWSIQKGEYKFGDPAIHDLIATKLVNEIESPEKFSDAAQAAANHYLVGTQKSVEPLVELCWSWYEDNKTKEALVTFLGLPVLDYLVLQNVKAAKVYWKKFMEKLKDTVEFAPVTVDDFAHIDEFADSELDVLNLVQLVVLTVQIDSKDLFLRVRKQYYETKDIKAACDRIGTVYFGIEQVKQVNFLQEMMSGFMKGP